MRNLLNVVLTFTTLILLTATTVLYSDGWRVNLYGKNTLEQDTSLIVKTGMLAIRSVPQGAKVYIDNVPITATDDTVSSLKPGKYTLKVEKEGFETWEKQVDVFPELVSDITAILILQSPRLEPLTNTNVNAFGLSTSQNNIAYLTKNHQDPGIWILPLNGSAINIFRSNSKLLVENSVFASPSLGTGVWWSPDDSQILVQMNQTGYFLYKLNQQGNTKVVPESITDVSVIKDSWIQQWQNDFLVEKLAQIQRKMEIPEAVISAAFDKDTVWAPDNDKFYYIDNGMSDSSKEGANRVLYVFNAEDPLPIGEQRLYQTLEIPDPENTSIYWYSDSYHLIIVTRNSESPSNYTINLVRIDGSNLTQIYNGYLASNQAYSTPSGDKILVLTTLKENSPSNIYGIAIR